MRIEAPAAGSAVGPSPLAQRIAEVLPSYILASTSMVWPARTATVSAGRLTRMGATAGRSTTALIWIADAVCAGAAREGVVAAGRVTRMASDADTPSTHVCLSSRGTLAPITNPPKQRSQRQ